MSENFDALVSANTKVLLRFDDAVDPYRDECGNTWTGTGSPRVYSYTGKFGGGLELNGFSQYVQMQDAIELGSRDFTIDGWLQTREEAEGAFVFYLTDRNMSSYLFRGDFDPVVIGLKTYPSGDTKQAWRLYYSQTANQFDRDSVTVRSHNAVGYVTRSENDEYEWHHFAIVYQRELQFISLFVDGSLVL